LYILVSSENKPLTWPFILWIAYCFFLCVR